MHITPSEQGSTRTRTQRIRLKGNAKGNHAAHVTLATAATPAVFAHDMRGPLANLTILLEAIAEAVREGHMEKIGRHVSRAMQSVEHLGGMLTAMLTRFRQLGDPLQPVAGDVELSDIVEAVASRNRPLAEQRGVRLLCTLSDPLPVRGDAHLLMQAIDSLLSNAITHTRPGGRVVCEAGSAGDGGVSVRITDEGPGLTAVEIGRLFHPFAAVGPNKVSGRTSLGLGLWIVALVAERHGGRIEAESDGPGTGATFTLHLKQRCP